MNGRFRPNANHSRKTISFVVGIFLLGQINCSRDNFLPMKYSAGIGSPNEISSTWQEYTVEPNKENIHLFMAQPGNRYQVDKYTYGNDVAMSLFAKKGMDSIWLDSLGIYSNFMCVAICTIAVKIKSVSDQTDSYWVRVSQDPVAMVDVGEYVPAAMVTTKMIVDGAQNIDTIGFVNPLSEFLYKFPLDSFEKLTINVDKLQYASPSNPFDVTYKSTSNSTLTHLQNDSSYWNTVPDTIVARIHLLNSLTANLLLKFGVFEYYMPKLSIRTEKHAYSHVPKDVFEGKIISQRILTPDSIYHLTLRKQGEIDSMIYFTNPDSIYRITIASQTSNYLYASIRYTNGGDNYSYFHDSATFIFKPFYYQNNVVVTVGSSTDAPAEYTITCGKYSGTKKDDSYEPDFFVNIATLLKDNISQSHVIFPANDLDFYKVACNRNDTFDLMFKTDIGISKIDSTKLQCDNYWGSQQIFNDVTMVAKRDSADCRIYSYNALISDTAYFRVTASDYISYTIMLRQ
jgi:hypothetical protein